MRLPFSDQAPEKIQQPQAVLPSSVSCAKPSNCSPALRTTFVLSLGSMRSSSAFPLYSRAISWGEGDRKSTRLNSSHGYISYAVFCLKKKNNYTRETVLRHNVST